MLWMAAAGAIASMGTAIGYALMATGGATCIWMPLSFFRQLNNKRFFAVILCGVALLMAAYALLSDSTPPIAAAGSVPAPSASPAAPAAAPPAAAPAGSMSSDRAGTPAPRAASTHAPATRPSSVRKNDLADFYTDNANGYSMCFPAGWTSHQFASGDPWFIDVSDAKTAMISVGFSPFPSSAGIEQLKPTNLAGHIKSRPRTTLLSQGSAKVAGKPALWFKYNGPVETSSGPRTMTCVHYYVPLGDGRMMELRLAALPEAFPRTAPLLRKSAATLKLFPL